MTRINASIDPKRLTNEHLMAEHREIIRMNATLLQRIMNIRENKPVSKIPDRFCLGQGHVLFFVDKPVYVFRRYRAIYQECINRGLNVQDYSSDWDFKEYFSAQREGVITFKPAGRLDYADPLIVERITQRIRESTKPYFHYYKRRVTKQEAINILNKVIHKQNL